MFKSNVAYHSYLIKLGVLIHRPVHTFCT